MQTNDDIGARRLVYENPPPEHLPEDVADTWEFAQTEVEDILAIITEIQNERINENGEVTEPLTAVQMNTILRKTTPLERLLGFLNTVDNSTEERWVRTPADEELYPRDQKDE